MGAARKIDEDRRGCSPSEAAVRARLKVLYGDQLDSRDPAATQRIGRAPAAARAKVEPARLATPVKPAPKVEAAPVADQPAQTAGFLCLRPLPPLPLANGLVLTIGRAPECHLMLPDSEVSRRHCTVTVQDGKVSVADLGSINGTLVNERRAQRADVRHGDVVTIGPYHLELLGEEAAQAWEAECAASAGAPQGEQAMSGRLGQVPLSEVLQQIEFNERTGTLEVACGRRRGSVVVEDGRPRSATFGKLTDGAAVLALLRLREGRFSFVRTRDLGACTMNQTFTALLLEASRRVDEGAPDEDPGEATGPMPAPAAGVRSPRLSLSLASALESIPEAVPVDLPVQAPAGADEPKTMALRQARLLTRLRAAAGQPSAGESTRARIQRRLLPGGIEPRPFVRSYSPTGIERQAMPAAQLPDQIRQIVARLEERTRENDPKPAPPPAAAEMPARSRLRPHPAWILTGAMAVACVGFAGRPTAFRSVHAGAPALGGVGGALVLAESPVESSRRTARPEASAVAGAWSVPAPAAPSCAPTPVESLEMARTRHCEAAWSVALADVEAALGNGDPQVALRQLGAVDPGKLGPAPAAARAIGARCMNQAAELAACRPSETAALTHLLCLLQLGRRLEAGSAPAGSIAPLLAALDAPGAPDAQLCLGLLEVADTKLVRRRVLLQVYRALEVAPAGRSAQLLSLLAQAATGERAQLSPDRAELLDFAPTAEVRAELLAARGIARAELGRLVPALRDVEKALALGCDDAALHDLRHRLADAVERSATLRARRVG